MKFLRTSVSPFSAFLLALTLLGCATPAPTRQLQRYQFEQAQMGVPFTIVMYAESQAQANTAAASAYLEITKLNQILSDYETDSELNELSRTSALRTNIPVSPHLWKVLARAQQIAHETGGAFDITLGPCISIWRHARRTKTMPEPDRLARAFERVGYTNLLLHPKTHTATLLKREMRLDLGGIAKGYAADIALELLRREHGITRALVAASGDVAVSEPPPGEKGWRVELAGYDKAGGPEPVVLLLKNAATSTAGDLSQRLEINGVRYSHILDPKTGVGLTNHSLVSVVAPTGLEADPIDTALCVMPPEAAFAYAEQNKIAARIIQQTPTGLFVRETTAFKKLPRASQPATTRRD